jgi:acylglycerol lipase
MNAIEYTWEAKDGQTLFARAWKPDGEPKACIILVHGLGEHSGRYKHMAEFFTEEGYAFFAFDLTGHGKSSGKRGHSSYNDLINEIDGFLTEIRNQYPVIPLFLYGHSLGGALVLYYISQKKPSLAGAIISAPSLVVGYPIPGWKKLLARLMSRMYPMLTMDNGLDRSSLSHDPKVEQLYSADPLVHPKISAKLAWDLLDIGKSILGQAECLPMLPYLFIQGSADHLADPKATRRLAENMHGDITLKIWEGFYHELHNEIQKQEVFQYLLNWLNQHSVFTSEFANN